MYATGAVNFTDTETIYALVQCTTDLSPDDCNTCLEIAIANTSSCCSESRGARLLSPSCYLRYEFYAFYEGTTCENPRIFETSKRKNWMIVKIVSAILMVVLLGFCVCYCLAIRNQTKTKFAMEGLYSVKSDVLSFRVLFIEIITGRRNATFHLTK
ncbi:Cysteine-rich receptor-like protein kinase 25 [Camellia lanceoleosa]|uniref:Cysteine-rich receptor-like protein kinase 25 n=1 Tax=Camellia lanceoleosa TaxID=1840588 RepID=A0ACC0GDX1_9ERIC|nr:Cysteine-rich receptor-like protein kinase 25 [Camellia lanceoleosa]